MGLSAVGSWTVAEAIPIDGGCREYTSGTDYRIVSVESSSGWNRW